MQHSYEGTPMPKYDFNKVASYFIEVTLRHGCYAVNLLHIFRIPFKKYIWRAATKFKEIWEAFHICLLNLTSWIRNEIHLFMILIIKSFIRKKERKKEDKFDLQTAWWEIIILELKVWFFYLQNRDRTLSI